MKLKCSTYNSPIDSEGIFNEVYIEDTSYSIDRINKMFIIKFEMYYIKNSKRIVLEEGQISFRGSNQDLIDKLPTTNRTTILSIPNENYDVLVAAIPLEIEIPNPEDSSSTITVPNPNYDSEVAAIPTRVNVNMVKYIYAHQGEMPPEYTVVDWGYATQEDALKYFTGGDLTNPELFFINQFAKDWFKNNVQMKGENVGVQFEFMG